MDARVIIVGLIITATAIASPEPIENITQAKSYQSIQQAIDDANNSDQIIVGPGTYYENLDFRDKNLTIASTEPNDQTVVTNTIINAGAVGAAVTFSSIQNHGAILNGFTITNALKTDDLRGAIICTNLDNSSPTILKCSIKYNENDGIELRAQSYPKIQNCIIAKNHRHGISGGYPTITTCTIILNYESGLAHTRSSITNSIVWANNDQQIKGTTQAAYCLIAGGEPGLGNIDTDPCFVDPNNDDFHLKSSAWRWDTNTNQWTWDDTTSRCIDAGNPASALADEPLTLDIDPLNRYGINQRINMGAYAGTPTAAIPPYYWSIRADINNDGLLDFYDFALWALDLTIPYTENPSDLDRNTIVDIRDFSILAENWLEKTIWFD
ncbi:MAG: right-handed parallel beta-helix repeat-containing protein [Planctomycetota bacterium]|jgi:parallel beta-helix repeat protein